MQVRVEAKPTIVEARRADARDERSEWQKQKLRILSYRKLREEKVEYTRQHLMRLEKAGLFPCRIQVGGNKVGWLEHEVDEWIMRRAAERGAA